MNDHSTSAGTLDRPADNPILEAAEKSLLIVDDDKPFLDRLVRAMELRGFAVSACSSVAEGLQAIASAPPAFAVVDMRLGDGNGLDVISELKAKRPDARGIILTGYGNITTAVTAVKLGAFDYLAKPPMPTISSPLDGDGTTAPRCRKTRCPPIGCAGSTSSAFTSFAAATSPRRHAASACTGAPCSVSWPSARRVDRSRGPPGPLPLRLCAPGGARSRPALPYCGLKAPLTIGATTQCNGSAKAPIKVDQTFA